MAKEMMNTKEFSRKAKLPYGLVLETTKYFLEPVHKMHNMRLYDKEQLEELAKQLAKLKGVIKNETENTTG
jgi:hypothetical protein